MLTHGAICACISGVIQYCKENGIQVDENDRFLSYLPLAHIFDRYGRGSVVGWVLQACGYSGAT